MQEILAHVQRDTPAILRFLEQMVNMDSPSLDKPLVDEFARFVGTEFAAIGGIIEYVPAERFGDHLVVRFQAGPPRGGILLLGHTDTVFPAGEARKRPYRVHESAASGPGVFDMKGGIAVMWAALRALRSLNRLQKPVTVLLTSDEEVGSPSSRDRIQSEALRASAVLVLEPSLPGGGVKTSRKGAGRFTVKAIGRAAHAGIDPEKGINAIEEIAAQVLQLQRMSDPARGTTVSVGVVQGGTKSNVVPAEAVIEVDVRVATADEAERITRLIRGLEPTLTGSRVEVRGGINRPPMERTADTVRLFEAARAVAAELGMDLHEGPTGGASDGNLTAALGVPTLDGLGPIGWGAHALTESIEVDSLAPRAALLAGLIERL